jgi:ATP-dependent Clp protease ATP-binding subunit ClpC
MTARRPRLSTQKISPELTQALNQAAALMRSQQKRTLTAEMLFQAFLQLPNVEAHRLLRSFSQKRGFKWADLERDAALLAADRRGLDARFDFIDEQGQPAALNEELIIVLDDGLTLAQSREETQCSTVHALAIMADIRVGTSWLLNKRGITHQVVLDTLDKPSSPFSRREANVDLVVLAKEGQLEPIYFRDGLLRDLMNRLLMTNKSHIILVGPAGVGKQSLVVALAHLIAQKQGPPHLKAVVPLSERALFEDPFGAVQAGLRLAKGGILFVPDIARFFAGSRGLSEFSDKASSELQKAFFGDDVIIIGTTTEERYKERLGKAGPILNYCQTMNVGPASVEETAGILKVLRPTFEADYKLTIIEKSLDEAARLAGRYYTTEPLPGAAVYLLHRACAMFRMDKAQSQVKDDNQLDPEDILVATSLLTGIPVTHMGADERDRYAKMAEHLHQRIIGQEEAVLALSRAVKMARVGLKEPKRPIGSFLFLGPTGVGKSELAKALAEFMFGTESALITLDMSEFMEDSSVNRLIGSPPGYIGHEAGGQLTDAVKQRPYSVVLFDEVEKASVKVFDVLLQVMDEGRLTSGKGETVSFSECVILMTSNIGGKDLADATLNETTRRATAEAALKAHFRPEFLNRLDDIIYFHSLSEQNLRDIFDLLLRREEKLMAGRDLHLELSDGAKRWILAQNEHPEWGARPLRRLIQKHLREPIADLLLKADPAATTKVKVELQDEKLVFALE